MSVEIIRGMPEAEYRARPERSQSDFKTMLEPTPAHALYKMQNRREKSCFDLGHALHSLFLEGLRLHAVEPVADGRTGVGKVIKAAFAAENQGKIILSAKDGEAVEGMVAGLMRNQGIVEILESAIAKEISIFWDGMKARLDLVFPLGVFDLKSCNSAEFRLFQKDIEKWGYHIQAPCYLDAAAVAGFPCENFFFGAVESSPPYEAALYRIGHRSLEAGAAKLRELKDLYYGCEESGAYPGYSQEPVEIDLPAWALRESAQ